MHGVARLPYSVDFRLIGACNLRCPFCFGPSHVLPAMATMDALEVINFIAEYGAKVIVVTGGEPTLVRGLPAMLCRMKHLGLKTILSTNGIRLHDRAGTIAPYLDWVALPLDASIPSVNRMMRVGHPDQFGAVLNLIPKLRARYPTLGIKLGTVICRINKDHVADIPKSLPSECLPDVWKIYQVSYSSHAKDNRSKLEISTEEFEEIAAKAERNAVVAGLRFAIYRDSERDGKYLFIDPTGDVIVIKSGVERAIGNVLANPQGVLDTWPKFVSEARMKKNIKTSYP